MPQLVHRDENYPGRIVASPPSDPITIAGKRWERCTFEYGNLVSALEAPHRVTDCHLADCVAGPVTLAGVVIDTCSIDGLRTKRLPIISGCVFKNVSLRGRVNVLKIGPRFAVGDLDFVERQTALALSLYADVDWAIDITTIDCDDLTIEGIPSGLVRRDCEWQPLLTREAATSADFAGIDMSGTNILGLIAYLRLQRLDEIIISGRTTGPRATRSRDVITELRRRGIVE